jgi:hypothetical protein
MTLEFLELMETMNNTQITKPEKPRRVRGTGIFDTAASTFSFQPMGEGEPVRHNVRKKGESQFFETKGEKQSSYICHLKVSKDSPDPAAEMQEQLEYFTKGIRLKEPSPPKSTRLLDKPGLQVWHRRQEKKVVIMMEVELGNELEMSSRLFNLTQEVTKCFAINQKKLSGAH